MKSAGKKSTPLVVFRREPNAERRKAAEGTYFRLVKEPDAQSKRARFEQALARLRQGEADPIVYRYRQSDFAAIPGSPWVYWITPGLRQLSNELPKLQAVAQVCIGMRTGDNSRFLRFWWEAGIHQTGTACRDANDAIHTGKPWFPYMKGGSFQRWHGNQEYIVKWFNDISEIKREKTMSTISIQEAQAQLPNLIHRLNPGDELVITENDQPVARLIRSEPKPHRPCKAGSAKNAIHWMAPDFDAPLDEFREYME